MGRPRKSVRHKKLAGTYRKDRRPPPTPQPGVPPMPRWLNAEAKSEWRRITPQLLALRVLYEVDGSLLADYCAAHALAVEATKKYQREGLVIEQHGQKMRHPMIKVAQEARSQAKQHIGEFHKRLAALVKEEGLGAALRQQAAEVATAAQSTAQEPPEETPLVGLRVVPKPMTAGGAGG